MATLQRPGTSTYVAVGEVLLEQHLAAVDGLDLVAAIEPHDVGEELDLLRQEVAVGPVDLAEGVPRVEEQHGVLTRRTGLGLVEEPQRHGQGDGVEEVGADRDHHVDRSGLDELLADLLLRVARRRPRSWP